MLGVQKEHVLSAFYSSSNEMSLGERDSLLPRLSVAPVMATMADEMGTEAS